MRRAVDLRAVLLRAAFFAGALRAPAFFAGTLAICFLSLSLNRGVRGVVVTRGHVLR